MIYRMSCRLAVGVTLGAAAGLVLGAPASAAAPADTSVPAPAKVRYSDDPRALPGQFIVSLRANTKERDVDRLADELTRTYGGRKQFVYTAAMRGFSVHATNVEADRMTTDPAVEYVAQDVEFTADSLGLQPNPPSWGLDRIDQRFLPRDDRYFYPDTAPDVTAYVIDTGIRLTHQEFGGRASCGFDPYLDGCAPCPVGIAQFHGTHVAATIGGRTVGVAKGVRIVSVRALDCHGSASGATVIAGVNFVTLSQKLNPKQRSVANMSLGGGGLDSLDDAVTASIAANVHYSVAAGNSDLDACDFSPARAPRATTLGSTGITDDRSAFSDIGPCVDLFAPGENILSASDTADNAYTVASGTSMASPHAAGAAALWRQRFPADNADQVAAALAANATPGAVVGPGAGSPNLLLFTAMIPV
jgi:subtilisin family serine protease